MKDIKDEIPNITKLATTTTTLNAKVNKVKGEIPSITSLATTAVLNDVENTIPDVIILAKKSDYDTKIGDIEKKVDHGHDDSSKYITIQEFNRLTAENFAARLKQENLVTKADIANFVKKNHFND